MIDPQDLYARGLISDTQMQRLGQQGQQYAMADVPPEVPPSGGFPAGKIAPSRELGFMRGGPGGGAAPAAPRATVIPPSSPNVAAAINRLKAWLPVNERNGPNPAVRRNIEIMQRGGPMAEAMANHTMKTWDPHPLENGPLLQAPTIDYDPAQ